jgi:RNA ligase (TIGR02306 family)
MENQNSVCYVANITEVKQIEGADNIELAVVGGWNCITKRGEYAKGDLVVVATTDAVIPVELSDSIGVTNYLRKGQRVRTIKLRGVYSECLLIPTKFIPGLGDAYYEGMDMMDKMGIFKYEPPAVPIQLASGRKLKYHQNPNFGIYYKFPNLKNVTGMFTEEDNVQITRKLHGTNARYGIVKKRKLSMWDRIKKFLRIADELVDYEYVYGSHNVEKGSDSQGFYSTDVWRTIAEKYDIKRKLREQAMLYLKEGLLGSGVIIYGEIYGAGIQKNYDYGLKDIEFAGFDLVINGKYEDVFYTEYIFGKYFMNLPHVPILYTGSWSQEIQDKFVFNNFIEIEELTITDFSQKNMAAVVKTTKIPHEGIVIKHVSGERNKVAKVINPDYLIYGEKHNVGDSH